MTVQETTPTQLPQAGDIWDCSWGYDETRIDFYRVVRATKSSVWLQSIPASVAEVTGWSHRNVVPNAEANGGEVFRRKLYSTSWGGGWGCSISSYSSASPWSGQPVADSSGSR